MINKLDAALQFHQTALSLRGERQELLAANIANADTPNYKARDFDFASALKNAMTGSMTGAGAQTKLAVATTSPTHLAGHAGNALFDAQVMYRVPVQPSADGNTVDMDMERAQSSDNALRYEASVKFVSDELKDMLAAIQG